MAKSQYFVQIGYVLVTFKRIKNVHIKENAIDVIRHSKEKRTVSEDGRA